MSPFESINAHYQCQLFQLVIPELQKLSLSKRGYVQSFCCENEFYFNENEKSFSYQWLST